MVWRRRAARPQGGQEPLLDKRNWAPVGPRAFPWETSHPTSRCVARGKPPFLPCSGEELRVTLVPECRTCPENTVLWHFLTFCPWFSAFRSLTFPGACLSFFFRLVLYFVYTCFLFRLACSVPDEMEHENEGRGRDKERPSLIECPVLLRSRA